MRGLVKEMGYYRFINMMVVAMDLIDRYETSEKCK